jgi:hypothetical protein
LLKRLGSIIRWNLVLNKSIDSFTEIMKKSLTTYNEPMVVVQPTTQIKINLLFVHQSYATITGILPQRYCYLHADNKFSIFTLIPVEMITAFKTLLKHFEGIIRSIYKNPNSYIVNKDYTQRTKQFAVLPKDRHFVKNT